jgi:hypothetical protein
MLVITFQQPPFDPKGLLIPMSTTFNLICSTQLSILASFALGVDNSFGLNLGL